MIGNINPPIQILFLKKLSIELPYDPVVPILDIYTNELKTETQNIHVYVCS